MAELKFTYAYLLLKIMDLLDTVSRFESSWKQLWRQSLFQLFFVLTKKNSHLTFLHCYHHFFLVVGSYIGVRWLPGGHPIFLGYINTIVHAIMYFYYFLTAFKPELKQSFWWKKHITQVQMVTHDIPLMCSISFKLFCGVFQFQFGILAAAFLRASLAAGCTYPKFWLWVLVVQNTFFLVLFTDFYRKTYFKNTNKAHWGDKFWNLFVESVATWQCYLKVDWVNLHSHLLALKLP